MADIDLAEANRIRVAMGLKPIETGPSFKESSSKDTEEEAASTLETRSALAEENYRKAQDEEAAKARRKAQKEAIRKAKESAMRNARMTGATLGDEDDELDTATWLRQQNKRQKKIERARKEEEEQAAIEKLKRAEYTSKDLAGVKVGHELGQFGSGVEQILTLKDAEIGEESEDDELENLDLREQERLKDKLELKKKKPIYNPNDDDGTGENKILSHYDEEINGKRQNKFTLDGFGSTTEKFDLDAEDAKAKAKGVFISLDDLKEDKPISDYREAREIKIKKPKKKKSKSTRVKNVEDDDIFNGTPSMEMEMQNGSSSDKRSFAEAHFDDDNDLQTKLAQQRRDALKKKKITRPEDIAKQLREEEENAMDGVENQDDEAPGLVFDETSEFVSHLEAPEDREEESRPRIRSKSIKTPGPDSDEDIEMEDDLRKHVKFETAETGEQSQKDQKDTTALDEETTMENGIGATLSMLRQRRHLDDDKHGDAATFRSYESFLAKKRGREDDAEREARRQRENDRQSDYYKNLSSKDREDLARKHNTQREQYESRAVADLFNKEYKPNVELKYIDEFGRSMNQKEAFKHLSHQFHGKGSGKQKHEKRLKKIEEEKKREAMSLDSSGHASNAAMGSKAKKNQQAGVRLQ